MNKKIIAIFVCLILLFSSITSVMVANAEGGQSNEKAYLLMDFDSGTIVDAKNENSRLPIASMVKITTLSLIFDAIRDGKLSLDDMVNISDYAFSMGGSQAFLDKNHSYRAEELIKSIIVASANDSCVAMAEHLCGSVDEFVAKMNEKAVKLGMVNTNYVNCTGLPAQNGYSSAKDVSIITSDLMQNEEFFKYSKIWMYDIEHKDGRTTTLTNTNKLVRFYNGMDGGKTGFTNEALYCLSCRATKGNTSLVCVVIGSPSSKERNARVAQLLNFGFANYESKQIANKDEIACSIQVKNGKTENVDCLYENDVKVFIKKGSKFDCKEEIIITKNIAPIKEGQAIGRKIYKLENGEILEVGLNAATNILEVEFGDILINFAKKW